MANSMDEVAAKIRKLLAVRTDRGATLEEAATAAGLAQRLMARYQIDAATIAEPAQGEARAEGGPEVFARHFVWRCAGPLPTWVMDLGDAVAEANAVEWAYSSHHGGGSVQVFGPADVAELCRALLEWLASEVARLELEEKRAGRADGGGRSFWNGFRNGCAATIGSRLRKATREEREAMKREAAGPTDADYQDAARAGDAERLLALDAKKKGGTFALARVESAIERVEARPARIEAWMKKEAGIKLGNGRWRSSGNWSGYARGAEAGKKATLRGAGKLSG